MTRRKIISRTFKTLHDAENFQWNLYGKYDSVRLVRSPFLSERGIYAWSVS